MLRHSASPALKDCLYLAAKWGREEERIYYYNFLLLQSLFLERRLQPFLKSLQFMFGCNSYYRHLFLISPFPLGFHCFEYIQLQWRQWQNFDFIGIRISSSSSCSLNQFRCSYFSKVAVVHSSLILLFFFSCVYCHWMYKTIYLLICLFIHASV